MVQTLLLFVCYHRQSGQHSFQAAACMDLPDLLNKQQINRSVYLAFKFFTCPIKIHFDTLSSVRFIPASLLPNMFLWQGLFSEHSAVSLTCASVLIWKKAQQQPPCLEWFTRRLSSWWQKPKASFKLHSHFTAHAILCINVIPLKKKSKLNKTSLQFLQNQKYLFQPKLLLYLLLLSTSSTQVVERTAIIKTTTTTTTNNTLTWSCGPPRCELLQISFYWLKMFIGYKAKFIAAVITPLCFLFAITVRQLFQFKIRIIVTWSSWGGRKNGFKKGWHNTYFR